MEKLFLKNANDKSKTNFLCVRYGNDLLVNWFIFANMETNV